MHGVGVDVDEGGGAGGFGGDYFWGCWGARLGVLACSCFGFAIKFEEI